MTTSTNIVTRGHRGHSLHDLDRSSRQGLVHCLAACALVGGAHGAPSRGAPWRCSFGERRSRRQASVARGERRAGALGDHEHHASDHEQRRARSDPQRDLRETFHNAQVVRQSHEELPVLLTIEISERLALEFQKE